MICSAEAPATLIDTQDCGLKAIARVEIVEQGKHYLKVTHHSDKVAWIPMSTAQSPTQLKRFLADTFGVANVGKVELTGLTSNTEILPKYLGTSRLGWSANHEAFLYDGTVFYATSQSENRYEFIAPAGTLIATAAKAFSPKGDRQTQYEGYQELWKRSEEFRLVLSLATVCPFMEILEAPTIAFHLVGTSGFGKTTLIRAGIAAFADPDSPLTKIDFSKDTQNYADAQLGILKNFPLLLDETTLHDSKQMAQVAYNIAMGRTKGRLGGPEQMYLPTEPLPYYLVCFLSGESSLREHMDQRGATARLMELVLDKPLFEKGEHAKWWDLASNHYGWYGRDLVQRVLEQYFKDGQQGSQLKEQYAKSHLDIEKWCSDHPRMVDFLAAVQVGYVLASRLLWHGFNDLQPEQLAEMEVESNDFVHDLYDRLNKRTKLDSVVETIQADPKCEEWVQRGYIPIWAIATVAEEFDLTRQGELGRFLINHGIVSKVESRKIQESSMRCYILTEEGKQRLRGNYHTSTTCDGSEKVN